MAVLTQPLFHYELLAQHTVNYFAHGLRYLDRPWFLVGTGIPDMLSVADRRVRMRKRYVEPFRDDDDEVQSELAAGVLQHLHDDDWFHRTAAFLETTQLLTSKFREILIEPADHRPGFLGHIVTELLLDSALTERHPDSLDLYYAALGKIDPQRLETGVNRMARRTTERLAPLLPLFLKEQFLRDYAHDDRLLFRLNQVMRRVKLATLPHDVISVLSFARSHVRDRTDDLLPHQHFH